MTNLVKTKDLNLSQLLGSHLWSDLSSVLFTSLHFCTTYLYMKHIRLLLIYPLMHTIAHTYSHTSQGALF